MIKVKICGITNEHDAKAACLFGADALGFLFAKSPRQVNINRAKNIIKHIPPFIARVGVFVNAEKEYVGNVVKHCNINVLQFHGEESEEYCNFFKRSCKVIKAFRIQDKKSLIGLSKYKKVDAFLLDSFSRKCYGGTGKSFNTSLLKNLKINKPLIIAGGVSEKNYFKIAKLCNVFAFDICSAVEKSPGKKDHEKIMDIIKKIKLL